MSIRPSQIVSFLSPLLPRSLNRVDAMAFLLILGLVWGWQATQGVLDKEPGTHPDEAAHFVTGLMIHDYLLGPSPVHPLAFARKFYDHYPKVALGHWPPGFYFLEAVWMFAAPASPKGAFLFVGLGTALLTWLVFVLLRPALGSVSAVLLSLGFLLVPLVSEYTGLVMTESWMAVLTLLSTLCYSRYWSTRLPVFAISFGLLASFTLLTKYSGLSLALIPVIYLLLSREWSRLKDLWFWAPAVIVPLLCGPWVFLTMDMAADGMVVESASGGYSWTALRFFPRVWLELMGAWGVLLLGWLLRARFRGSSGLSHPMALGSAALFVSVLILHIAVPASLETRHLLPALAPSFLLLGYAMPSPANSSTVSHRVIWGLIGATLLIRQFLQPLPESLPVGGMKEAVQILRDQATHQPDKGNWLVLSDAVGEGMFIADVASGEKRPGNTVIRGSKLFAESNWNATEYESTVEDPKAVLEMIRDQNIRYVVLDRSVPEHKRLPYHDLFAHTLREHPARFKALKVLPLQRKKQSDSDALHLFEMVY